jgi:UDP:flavonoid glycosyltransferase YjiC (YdhE family)
VKIMFASLGAYGHLYPMMPLALAGRMPVMRR